MYTMDLVVPLVSDLNLIFKFNRLEDNEEKSIYSIGCIDVAGWMRL